MLQEEMSAIVDRNPFAKHIGMKLTEVRLGYAKGTVPDEKRTPECLRRNAWRMRLFHGRYDCRNRGGNLWTHGDQRSIRTLTI